MPKKLMPKVQSLFDLRTRANIEMRYAMLAIAAAENLGGGDGLTLDSAMRWLRTNAAETDERGVVAEVNACRDLV